MKPLLLVLLSLPSFLDALTCQAATLPGLPRTKEHFKCRFSDGSYVEYKHLETWLPAAAAIPHAQSTEDGKTLTQYVVPDKPRLEIELPVQFGCESVGKRDGRLFYHQGFEDRQRAFVLVGVAGEFKPFHLMPQISRPASRGCTKSTPDPLLAARGLQDAMRCAEGWMMQEAPEGGIIAESPVWSSGKSPTYPRYGVVHFVFRTRYNPETQAWLPVELSDTGPIYEVGKTRGDQSWAARYECLVDRPRGGCPKDSR